MNRVLNDRIEEIAKMFFEDLKTLRQIAEEIGYSAMAIQKALKRNGYDTSKEGLNLEMECEFCKSKFKKLRASVRKSYKHFCSNECYQSHLKKIDEKNITSRYHQMASRKKMITFYGDLPKGSIVHHIDGNDMNTDITNLMLLKSQGDHLMVHRGYGNPEILFDGRNLKSEPSSKMYYEVSKEKAIVDFRTSSNQKLSDVVLNVIKRLNDGEQGIFEIRRYDEYLRDDIKGVVSFRPYIIPGYGVIKISKVNNQILYNGIWQ